MKQKTRNFAVLTLLLAVSLNLVTAQQKHFVKAGASGDGSSWATPSGDLQLTITNAGNLDTIFVAGGVYQPVAGSSFNLKDNVAIFGSFAGTESALSQRNLQNGITSILKGNGNSVVAYNGSLSVYANLDGFQITGGSAVNGGGIYAVTGGPTLANLIIHGNNAAEDGGGIYSYHCGGTMRNVLIYGNGASTGGGIVIESSFTSYYNVTTTDNTAQKGGG